MRYEFNKNNIYNLPGGNPDRHETLMETLKRELFEELCVEVNVGRLIIMGEVSLKEQKDDVLHCIFLGDILNNIPELNPNETSAKEIVWIPIENLPITAMYPNVGAELKEKLLSQSAESYVGRINQTWL